MHASILIGKDKDLLDRYIQKIPGRKIDYEVSKIDEVRGLRGVIKFSYSEPVLVILRDIDMASIEAQSALLKSIEEPSVGVSFALTALQEEKVLPTILSRGKVIYLNEPGVNKHRQYAQDFFDGSVGLRLEITSKIKSREEAAQFLNKIVIGGHELMLERPSLAKNVEEAERALGAINMNGNIQLQLTSFVVSLETKR